MKILLFNWAPIDPVTDGGGVAIYSANLARAFADLGHEVTFLSSGAVYDAATSRVFVRARKPVSVPGVKQFDVVNSRLMAPSYLLFSRIETALDEPETMAVVEAFLQTHGPFDIFHIQNIEGIPYATLALRKKFPQTKFILSNHNYHTVCQQVNLWFQDRARCTNYREGSACYACNVFEPDYAAILAERVAASWQERVKSPALKRAAVRLATFVVKHRPGWRARHSVPDATKYAPDPVPPRPYLPPADRFVRRRKRAVELINEHCDTIISVSRAVEDILLKKGLRADKSVVSYIGTRHYHGAIKGRSWAPAVRNGVMHLAFLGYTRPDKGFQFLVDAMQKMPAALEQKIKLTFAGKISDAAAMKRLQACASKMAGLEIIESYRQSDLPTLLSDVDLGLVLPLWDDALPQVAIEFVCHGVPIFVSDRGGQVELAADPAFIFAAGNIPAFWSRIAALFETPALFDRFWAQPSRPLRSMQQHAAEMLEIYETGAAAAAADPLAAAAQ